MFLLSALDTSFLVMPFGNDFLLIALVTSNKPGPIWILYVVVCALGSTLGALIDDLLARKAGERGLQRFVNPNQIKQLKAKIEEHAGWVLFTSTLLPPPFPFTAVIMTTAALQHPRKKVLLVVLAGRLLRFTLIALLALHFGKHLLVYARKSPVFEYILYAIIGITLVASTLTLLKWFRGRRK